MSDGNIVFIAILAFLLLSQLISSFSKKGGWGGRQLVAANWTANMSANKPVVEQLERIEQTLRDISERVTSIEGILQQVE